jgi:hypothetical protein
MRIPKHIKIGGHRYKVNRIKGSGMGGADTGQKEIIIGPDGSFPESTLSETVLHEIIEIIAVNYDMALRQDHKELTALSEVLFGVMRDNKLDFSGAHKG